MNSFYGLNNHLFKYQTVHFLILLYTLPLSKILNTGSDSSKKTTAFQNFHVSLYHFIFPSHLGERQVGGGYVQVKGFILVALP